MSETTELRKSMVGIGQFNYALADQIADLGEAATDIRFEVRQVGLGGMLSPPAKASM